LYFYIQDLIVQPDFQSKGVGTAILQALMTYLKANAKPGSFVGLMAATGRKEFYRKFDFKVRAVDAPGMYRVWT